MSETPKNRQWLRVALLIFAAHTFVFAIQIPQVYFNIAQNPQIGNLWVMIARLAWAVYLAALIAPFVLWAGARLPLARRHLRRNLLIHLALAVVSGVVNNYGYSLGLLAMNLTSLESFRAGFFNFATLFAFIYTSVMRYAAVIGIQQAYFYYRESQESAFRLQEAEMQMLKMQMHPHFFFNTLNAVSALMYSSPREADRMITRLGDLFRVSLRKDKAQEIPLKDELEFLESFLLIHQTLMGKRLRIEWRIEPETLDALVPNLILQPLAENAIQHGVAPVEEGGRIEIRAARRNDCLVLEVRDDGLGFAWQNGGKKTSGIGLGNTVARLKNLYNGSHKFSIDSPVEGGVAVRIEIPFREAARAK